MSNPAPIADLLMRFQRWRFALELEHSDQLLLDEVAQALRQKMLWAEERIADIEQLEEEVEAARYSITSAVNKQADQAHAKLRADADEGKEQQ